MIEAGKPGKPNFRKSMALQSTQPKLIGFVSQEFRGEEFDLKAILRVELENLRDLYGYRRTVLASIRTRSDLALLQSCIQLRIPFILILPEDPAQLSEPLGESHWSMASHLMSVSLARYAVPGITSPDRIPALILEWADGFLCVKGEEDHFHDTQQALDDAAALGIPSKIIHGSSSQTAWNIAPEPQRAARHGFETRQDLLEFFDSRLGAPVVS